MKFRYFILRFENAVESLEIIEFDINIPSGIGAQQFERPAHLFPVFSTIQFGQSASHVCQDIVFHSRA